MKNTSVISREWIIRKVLFVLAMMAVFCIVLIIVMITRESIPALTKVGLPELFSNKWEPKTGNFGINVFIVGTLLTTLGGLIIAVPLAMGAAIFLTQIAPKRLSAIVSRGIEILAGIPSVIIGWLGFTLLVPLVGRLTNSPGAGILAASIILGIMSMPTITSIARDALETVPASYRQASIGLGATRWQTIWHVMLPAAKPGLMVAAILGMGRAIGETVAVAMVIGPASTFARNLTTPTHTLTTKILIDMGESSGIHRSVLFFMALVLLVISMTLIAAVRLTNRKRKPSARKGHGLAAARSWLADKLTIPGLSINSKLQDRIATVGVMLLAMLGLVVLGIIIAAILWQGLATALNPGFIFGEPQAMKAGGGIWPMIVSSFYLAALTIIIALPVGVGSAIYLSEYAKEGRITRLVRFGADALSSVPSVVFGIFGMMLFVVYFGFGYSLIAGALTLTILNLPTVMRTSEEALKAVPDSYREASMGLGASRWYTLKKVILPCAVPGITTGAILTVGRIIGESAAVIYTVGIFIKRVPVSPFAPAAPMSANIWHLFTEGALIPDAVRVASGEAAFLLLVVLALNLLARYVSYVYKKRTRTAERFV